MKLNKGKPESSSWSNGLIWSTFFQENIDIQANRNLKSRHHTTRQRSCDCNSSMICWKRHRDERDIQIEEGSPRKDGNSKLCKIRYKCNDAFRFQLYECQIIDFWCVLQYTAPPNFHITYHQYTSRPLHLFYFTFTPTQIYQATLKGKNLIVIVDVSFRWSEDAKNIVMKSPARIFFLETRRKASY